MTRPPILTHEPVRGLLKKSMVLPFSLVELLDNLLFYLVKIVLVKHAA